MTEFDELQQRMTVACDECGAEEIFYGTFMECITQAKEEGWYITKEDNEYRHWCINCQELL